MVWRRLRKRGKGWSLNGSRKLESGSGARILGKRRLGSSNEEGNIPRPATTHR